VPEVLLGGDHAAIRRWRLKDALKRTWLRRPELLEKRQLTDEERGMLAELRAEGFPLNSRG
jgi:tRNA (guanine37-N1)-methyltransferase